MGKIDRFTSLKGDFWSDKLVGVRRKCKGLFERTYTGENLMNTCFVSSVKVV